MPGFTTPDGFIFEVPGDQPLISLTSGQSGTFPILSEQVQNKFNSVGLAITDLADRVAVLEAAVDASPWRRIDSGSFSGHGFTINVPAGTYAILRLHLHGDLDVEGQVQVRINGDTSATLHRAGLLAWDADGVLDFADWREDTSWDIAHWGTQDHQSAEMTIYRTDQSDQQTFHCIGGRSAPAAGGHRVSLGWGDLNADRSLSSLEVTSSVGTDFSNLNWWLEGFVA